MFRKDRIFGGGTYPSGCPHCKNKSNDYLSGFRMIETQEICRDCKQFRDKECIRPGIDWIKKEFKKGKLIECDHKELKNDTN